MIVGEVRFKDDLHGVLRSAKSGIEAAVARGGVVVQDEAKRLLNLEAGPTITSPTTASSGPGEPPHKRTGHLGRNVQTETAERDGTFFARTGTNVKYGKWLELGAKAHMIIAKKGRALRFVGHGGAVIFRKRVFIPRLEPRPWLRPAMDHKRKDVLAEIKKVKIKSKLGTISGS